MGSGRDAAHHDPGRRGKSLKPWIAIDGRLALTVDRDEIAVVGDARTLRITGRSLRPMFRAARSLIRVGLGTRAVSLARLADLRVEFVCAERLLAWIDPGERPTPTARALGAAIGVPLTGTRLRALAGFGRANDPA